MGWGMNFTIYLLVITQIKKNLGDKYITQCYIKNLSENKMKGMLSICHVQLYKQLYIFKTN